MRTNKFLIAMLSLILIQIFINTNISYNFLYFDLIYVVIFYLSIKLKYKKAIILSTILGLLTDYLSMGILGVFGVSRAIASYIINTITKYFDINKDLFLIIIFFFSILTSNIIANILFILILNIKLSFRIILFIPLITTGLNYILFKIKGFKNIVDVNN